MIATSFRTARLALLPLEVGYAEEMAKVLASPELYVFTGGEPPTADVLTARYERQRAGPAEPGESWLNWVISLEDELIGYIQATATTDQAEIAWVVGTAWQGHGYAKEVARGLVEWLQAAGVELIVAHIHPDHTASASVASAAGLRRTDHIQDGEYRWENYNRPG